MARYLTLDLGTTFFKAVLFEDTGEVVALRRAATPIRHPFPGGWEVTVEDFDRTVNDLLLALREATPGGFDGVEAMSFATQANSMCLLDRQDQPLTPIVLWLDVRDEDQTPEMAALGDHAAFRRSTGIPVYGGNFASARLKKWSRLRHDWSQVGKVCLISDLLTWRMTGQHVTEGGAAGLSGLVDIHDLTLRSQVMEWSKLATSCFARVARAGTDLGSVHPTTAQRTGLPRNCRFIVGCLDQYAGAIGAGNLTPGGVSETTGTALATVRCADHYDEQASRSVYQGPSFAAGTYWQLAAGSISANLLEAYHRNLGDTTAYAALDNLAEAVEPGAEGLRIRPDALPEQVEAMFVGRTRRHGRAHEVRAILEAVSAALAGQVRTLCGTSRPAEIRSVGGAARSDLWRRIKADVLGIPIVGMLCPEPTSLGAAMLAMSAVSRTDLSDIVRRCVKCRPADLPDAQRHARYQQIFPVSG
ncbi:MAG: FGGY-family carbohydrate kinase [Phycisphaeraceae bacterium]|nr:FGGY-family carbohydrate kinase [Phycisphaeraceae bacterium]